MDEVKVRETEGKKVKNGGKGEKRRRKEEKRDCYVWRKEKEKN